MAQAIQSSHQLDEAVRELLANSIPHRWGWAVPNPYRSLAGLGRLFQRTALTVLQLGRA